MKLKDTSRYYIDPHSVIVDGKPSSNLADKLEKDEIARIKAQVEVERLGPESLKRAEAEVQYRKPKPSTIGQFLRICLIISPFLMSTRYLGFLCKVRWKAGEDQVCLGSLIQLFRSILRWMDDRCRFSFNMTMSRYVDFVFISRETWLTRVISLISLLYKFYSPFPRPSPVISIHRFYYRILTRHPQVYHDLPCHFLFCTTEKTVWRRAYPRGSDKQAPG